MDSSNHRQHLDDSESAVAKPEAQTTPESRDLRQELRDLKNEIQNIPAMDFINSPRKHSNGVDETKAEAQTQEFRDLRQEARDIQNQILGIDNKTTELKARTQEIRELRQKLQSEIQEREEKGNNKNE